jgi:hypothetical protein
METTLGHYLTHHKSFFNIYFSFNQLSVEYIAMEHYESNLEDFYKPYDLRNLLLQICEGLKFLHETHKIAHGDIKMENIAVVQLMGTTQRVFKIMNFSEKTTIATTNIDISSLGAMLKRIHQIHNAQIGFRDFSINDENLLADLISQCLKPSCSADELQRHPFLLSHRETLNFIVEFAKFLESTRSDDLIVSRLKADSWKIIIDD